MTTIYIIRVHATSTQMEEMLAALGIYMLAGGGELHADCERALLEDGSQQEDIWGADWYPSNQSVGYESLINLRPRQGNRSIEIQDFIIREQVSRIVQILLAGA